jgi:probable rRNA maturation factor
MISLDIAIKSKKWEAEKNIENFLQKTGEKIIPLTDLKKILTKDFTLEIAISLVCDAQMKKINSQFRGKDKATNVLSFSNLDENLIRKIGIKKAVGSAKYLLLGDIVISYETLKKESLAQKKKFFDHMFHLVLHSILHLIGYDHEDEKMAKIMEKLEIKILQKSGIKNPYILNFKK